MKQVKFGDVSIGDREVGAVTSVLRSGWLTHGPRCDDLEQYLNGAVCSSGTAALHLALAAIGCGPGDEVILPATTFVATLNAVLYTGATPVIVDVSPGDWTINWSEVRRRLTPRTRAIITVWLYGAMPSMVNVADVEEVAHSHFRSCGREVCVVEDRSESYPFDGNGDPNIVETYSFYANKVATCGEGGLVRSANDGVMSRVRHLRGHAQTDRYRHDQLGFNYRMTEMQAALLRCQCDRAGEFINQRNALRERYVSLLADTPLKPQGGTFPVAWGMAVLIPSRGPQRSDVVNAMDKAGVETRPVFAPMGTLPQAANSHSWPCVVANRLRSRGIVLPLHQSMTLDDVDYVCDRLLETTS